MPDSYYSIAWLLMDYARDYDRDGKFAHFVGSMVPDKTQEALLNMLSSG